MKYIKHAPDVVLYNPDKETSKGILRNLTDFNCTYNFGAASEMTLKIPQKIYDNDSHKWIDNPCYDDIEEDMLLYTLDDTEYFSFTGATPGTECSLADPTELFDLGIGNGYDWCWGGFIDTDGIFMDNSYNLGELVAVAGSDYYAWRLEACASFIPVSYGDIIEFPSSSVKYYYNIFKYTEADARKYSDGFGGYRSLGGGDKVKLTLEDDDGNAVDKFFIRISVVCYSASFEDNIYKTYLVPNNYIKIYSRERNVISVKADNSSLHSVKLPWWVITNIEENTDGLSCSKTVTALSYESILSKRLFSLSSGTLPLYRPDDCTFYYESTATNEVKDDNVCRGLLNQILDYIPDWTIGWVDPDVCVRYRSFDDVDNANLYTFLTDEVQKAYHCYFIFDSRNMTINVIDGNLNINDSGYNSIEGQVGSYSDVGLTWNNTIKEATVKSDDNQCVSALRVHTAEDTYGLGLINPTGNSYIYNFQSYYKYMSDDLKTAVKKYVSSINTKVSSGSLVTNAKNLVNYQKKVIELDSELSEALTEYQSIADKINTHLLSKTNDSAHVLGYLGTESSNIGTITLYSALVPETPPEEGYYGYYTTFWSEYKTIYDEYGDGNLSKLISSIQTYNACRDNYDETLSKYNTLYSTMKSNAIYYTMNYNTAISNSGSTLLTAEQILELQKYIVEGDWTNENAVFSDDVSANDIVQTLQEVYEQAKEELDSYISRHCYEIEVSLANILKVEEMSSMIENLTLGKTLSLEVKPGEWQCPVLTSISVNYDNPSDFSMTFCTNYSAKPLKNRFMKLFGTINQTSVKTSEFTFSE